MRILFLALDVDLEEKSGQAIHVLELTRNLAASGNEIALVTATAAHIPELPPGCRHYRRPDGSSLRQIIALLGIWRSFRPRAVYERRFSAKIGVALKFLTLTPLVIEINGLVDQEMKMAQRSPPSAHTLVRWFRRASFRAVDRFVAVTPQIAEALTRDYGVDSERIAVIANGANLALFTPRDRDESCRAVNLEPRPYVTFIGSLLAWQGVEYLVEAAEKIGLQVPEARILVVGDGPVRREIEKLARKQGNRVLVVGWVPYSLVPFYLGASSVVVVPKVELESGFSPLKLYEAMAAARPVVASRVPGLEIVEEAGAGLLVPPRDPSAIAQAVLTILGNRPLADEMGRRGRDEAARQFSWRVVAERVELVIRSVGAGVSG